MKQPPAPGARPAPCAPTPRLAPPIAYTIAPGTIDEVLSEVVQRKLETVDNYFVQAAAAEALDLRVGAALAAFAAHAKACSAGCSLIDDCASAACAAGAELVARATLDGDRTWAPFVPDEGALLARVLL